MSKSSEKSEIQESSSAVANPMEWKRVVVSLVIAAALIIAALLWV